MFRMLIAIGWLYVALMMAVAEATHATGTVLGALITFVFYGVGPLALLLYILGAPARRRLRREREAQASAITAPSEATTQESGQPDAGRHPPADPVAPVREES